MSTVVVVDYGMGNLRSVVKALEHVAPKSSVLLSHDPDVVAKADHVVFPGQGAIAGCISALDASGLRQALLEAITSKPFLGICLGLQALYNFSEEGGGVDCLAVFSGQTRRFPEKMKDTDGQLLKIPHMGWNQVRQTRNHPLWQGIAQDARFYFVHSYYVESADPAIVAGTTDFGLTFTSAAGRDNVFAVQFHPEKSQHAGLKLLENFVRWDGQE